MRTLTVGCAVRLHEEKRMRDRNQILNDVPAARDFERGDEGIDGTGLTLSAHLMLEVLLDIRDLLAAKK